MNAQAPLLVQIENLRVEFGSGARPVRAVDGVDLALRQGEIVGIAGESGSGKTTLCGAMIRAATSGSRLSGRVLFRGRDLYALSPRELREMRGREIALIPQNPMTSLDPLFTIGDQLGEVLRRNRTTSRADIPRRAIELLESVRISAPDIRLRQYPHELSGGMRQRVLIAMAIANHPSLLVADEPTTAVDPTIQEELLTLLRDIRDATGATIVIVTHDLSIIRRICERVILMYAGRIVEEGPVADVFSAPAHPYGRALIDSIPVIVEDRVALRSIAGQSPDLATLGDGCAFAERCRFAASKCRSSFPEERRFDPNRRVYCWNSGGEND